LILGCTLHEKLHAQQGLAAAGVPADKRWSSPRQTAKRNLIEPVDSRTTFGNSFWGRA